MAEPAGQPDPPLAPGLYLVATPIGNLEDITLRALRVLRSVDRIACEDTRQTAKLLNHFGIKTPTVSYHVHNEQGRAEDLTSRSFVREAASPWSATPACPALPIPARPSCEPPRRGRSRLRNSRRERRVDRAGGERAAQAERFVFRGFLPSKEGERRSTLEAVLTAMRAEEQAATQIFYETPHRIVDALADVEAVFGPMPSHRAGARVDQAA